MVTPGNALQRFLLASLILFSNGHLATAGITIYPSEIRVEALPIGTKKMSFCTLDDCRTIGRERGYTAVDWTQLKAACLAKPLFGGKTKAAAELVFMLISLTAGPGLVIGLSGMAFLSDGRVDTSLAGTALNGSLNSSLSNIQLTPEDFVELKLGLNQCVQDYELHLKYQRMQMRRSNPNIMPPDMEPLDEEPYS